MSVTAAAEYFPKIQSSELTFFTRQMSQAIETFRLLGFGVSSEEFLAPDCAFAGPDAIASGDPFTMCLGPGSI